MDVSYGGGEASVVMDFSDRTLVVYDGSEAFHTCFGGRTYYKSCSGLSAAGWIEDRLDRLVVRGYRTETATPWAGCSSIAHGIEVGIPTRRNGAACEVAPDFPALVRDHRGLVLCAPIAVFGVIAGEFETSEHEYVFDAWQIGEVEPTTYSVPYHYCETVDGCINHRAVRSVLPVLRALHKECYFRPGEPHVETLTFWRRLGLLMQADGMFYKFSRGIAWYRYEPADLRSQEQRQEAAPRNVLFLTDRHYLQRDRDGRYDAVGLSDCGRYDFEIDLDSQEAMRALTGDHAGVVAALDAGIAEKESAYRASAMTDERFDVRPHDNVGVR